MISFLNTFINHSISAKYLIVVQRLTKQKKSHSMFGNILMGQVIQVFEKKLSYTFSIKSLLICKYE